MACFTFAPYRTMGYAALSRIPIVFLQLPLSPIGAVIQLGHGEEAYDTKRRGVDTK